MVGGKYLTGGSGVPGESIELNDMYGVGGLTPGIYTLKLVDVVSIN